MWIAIGLVAGIALVAGLILAVASVLFAVPRDELAEQLREHLPGANCGACGFSGCDGYAAAMSQKQAPVGLCPPGGEEALAATSEILGVTGDLVRITATLRCGGCDTAATRKFKYTGVQSCRGAMQLYGGDKECPYGCLGYGDCAAACDYHAISIENGLAKIDPAKCKGCSKCVNTCPRELIALLHPAPATVYCRSKDKGATVRRYCSAGCIGCMKCVKVCEAGAVTVTDLLATVDPDKCTACGKCVEVCPVHCIQPGQKI